MPPRIEVVKAGELIMVHDITVNYDQLPAEAVKGFQHDPLIAKEFGPAKWNGGRSGTKETTLRLHQRGEWLSTPEARRFVKGKGDVPCTPAAIAPLGKMWQELWEAGVLFIVALCESDKQLWWDPSHLSRAVCLSCGQSYCGFNLGYADVSWHESDWFAGLPR